jgi:cysteine desulfurase / selenocysteine lyase
MGEHARLGLGVAVDYALAIGIEPIMARCRALADQLRFELSEIPGVAVYDLGPRPAAIVTFSVGGYEANAVKSQLAGAGINVSTSRPSSTLLDATARSLPTIVRASPHYYNTEGEIRCLTEMIRSITNVRLPAAGSSGA